MHARYERLDAPAADSHPRSSTTCVSPIAATAVTATSTIASRRLLPQGARVFTVFSTSKDHRQGAKAMAGCILVDFDKIQVINRSPKYKNKYVPRDLHLDPSHVPNPRFSRSVCGQVRPSPVLGLPARPLPGRDRSAAEARPRAPLHEPARTQPGRGRRRRRGHKQRQQPLPRLRLTLRPVRRLLSKMFVVRGGVLRRGMI